MIEPLPPAVILIVGALLVPCFKGRFRSAYLLAVPTLAFVDLLGMPPGMLPVIDSDVALQCVCLGK